MNGANRMNWNINKNFEMKYKKQLSKQAKKEYAIRKANASSFEWEDEM